MIVLSQDSSSSAPLRYWIDEVAFAQQETVLLREALLVRLADPGIQPVQYLTFR